MSKPNCSSTSTTAAAGLTKPAATQSSCANGADRPFIQLAQTPLVPEAVLKRHGAYCATRHEFRSGARLLQCLWLKDQGISTASSVRSRGINTGSSFGSILDAADLQSVGPLALDRDLATAVFRRLLPDFVHTVEHIIFEHSPGRREDRFLKDRTAFDLAIRVITPDGEPATVFVEVEYSESMEGPAARMRDRYNEASHQTRLYRDPLERRSCDPSRLNKSGASI